MRKPIAFVLSLAVVSGLFLAMSWMIEAEGVAEASVPPPSIPAPHVERPEPPPPSAKPEEPELPPLRPGDGPEVDLPPVDAPSRPTPPEGYVQPGPDALLDSPSGLTDRGRDTTVRVAVPPQYPPRALMSETEGWVRIEFSIAPDGSVMNARVIDAHPRRGLFDDAALTAVSRWIYYPATENGIAIASHGHRVTVDFNLASQE